jgi:putative membrane protein insertion efficiency factor
MTNEIPLDDTPVAPEPSIRDLPLTLGNLPRLPLLALIRLYQMTFARGMPPGTCRFYPTCSHYGYQAIYKHGAIKGSIMAIWRVLRCNPFNPGGYDPVP